MAIEPAKRIPPSLYSAMVLQYAVGGAFLPFVTLYFRDRGLNYHEIGWILLGSSLVSSTMPLLYGYVADRIVALERLIATLHFIGVLALLFLAWQSTFMARLVVFSVVVGIVSPTGALLNAFSYHNLARPEEDFGRLRLWGSIGWMLPSLPVFLWHEFVERIDLGFILYLAAAVESCMALVALCLPHTPPSSPYRLPSSPSASPCPPLDTRASQPAVASSCPSATAPPRPTGERPHERPPHESCPHQGSAAARSSYKEALWHLLRHRGFTRFIVMVFLMHGSFAIHFYYTQPLLESVGFERKWIGPLQCLGTVVEVPLLLVLPWAIRRLGYGGTIAVGCAALLVRQTCCAVSTSPWVIVWSYVLSGLCVVFYLIGGSLALNAMAGRGVRATAQTVYSIVGQGLGQMIGHQVAGILADTPEWGLGGVFVFASLTAGLALAMGCTLAGRGIFRRKEGETGRSG